MRRFASVALLVMTAIPAFAAKKVEGTTILKDSQPTGTTDKEHKHQVYDLSFNAAGNLYTCRTSSDKSMNATDFVVGSQMTYQIDGKKAKLKTPEGKEVECKVVRVEAPTTP
jgi:hypothetical protein